MSNVKLSALSEREVQSLIKVADDHYAMMIKVWPDLKDEQKLTLRMICAGLVAKSPVQAILKD